MEIDLSGLEKVTVSSPNGINIRDIKIYIDEYYARDGATILVDYKGKEVDDED